MTRYAKFFFQTEKILLNRFRIMELYQMIHMNKNHFNSSSSNTDKNNNKIAVA